MRSFAEAREALGRLAGVALSGAPHGYAREAAWLGGLAGDDWLRLDDVARGWVWVPGIVTGEQGWAVAEIAEPTGLVAAVLSMHVNGYHRQRAARVLGTRPGSLYAAALAVRCLDHVEQVRAEALPGLLAHSGTDELELAVGVLSAGARRLHAVEALDRYTARVLATPDAPARLEALRASRAPAVRRWAFGVSLESDLLSASHAAAILVRARDPWVRRQLASWLRGRANVQLLAPLLTSKYVESRLLAADLPPDAALDEGRLHALLLDPSQHIRDVAQGKARSAGLDIAGFYRAALAAGSPRCMARCIAEVGHVGDGRDTPRITELLAHASSSVRAAAVSALARLDGAAARSSLEPMLLDPSPRVSAAASFALVKLGAGPDAAAAAWSSALPSSRRAAYRLHHASGRWHRVEASLRAATDADPRLRHLGAMDLLAWLAQSAATTWGGPDVGQRVRLSALLAACPLDEPIRRLIAFHAGVSLAG